MGLLDRFRASAPALPVTTEIAAAPIIRKAWSQGTAMEIATTAEQIEEFLRRGSGQTASGAYVTAQTAMCVAAVYRCVALISGNVATMPLHLKRRLDHRHSVDASDHPLWNVLRRRPNRWQTPSQFRRQMQAHVLLRGRGRAMKVRSGRDVVGLIPLHPDRVQSIQTDDLSIEHVYTRKDGSQITIPQQDMFDLVGMSLDGVNGLSVLSCARETIGSAIAMRDHGSGLFRNGTHVGGVISHKGKLGQDGQDLLRDSLDKFRGSENTGKNLILEEGMTYDKLGLSLVDAEFIASRALEDRHIFMFFGVPPHLAGDTEKATNNGSGLETQTLGFQAFTMEDHLTSWEETIQRDCLPPEEQQVFPWFNRAASVKNDVKSRNAAYTAGRNGGWLSKNDIRGLENMNPIETPDGDDYSAPLNSNANPTVDGGTRKEETN